MRLLLCVPVKITEGNRYKKGNQKFLRIRCTTAPEFPAKMGGERSAGLAAENTEGGDRGG